MSVSAVSASTNVYQDRMSQLQSVRQDFSSLTTSLASGDLTGAQTAFRTLVQDMGNTGAQKSRQTGTTSQLPTDLTTLGTALNSKDLTAAQKAFATLLDDLKAGGLHRHHHRHKGSAQNTTDTLNTDLTTLGNALNSGDLTAAQSAFATLMQDIGSSGTQSTTATGSTDTQSATNGQSSAASALLTALQTAAGTLQNGSVPSVSTLVQALNLYAHVGQFNLSLPSTGLFSTTG
jgi:hypothetical protein